MGQEITVEKYIDTFPENVRRKLIELRQIIKSVLPESKEVFSYGIPTYDINGHVVHFAGYKNHIGFYPTSSGIDKFKTELEKYKCSKGTVRFSIDEPLPKELLIKIIQFRKDEDGKKNH
jgi:uncharacterized protein YdhG (YjbR/CyaY superfamily)